MNPMKTDAAQSSFLLPESRSQLGGRQNLYQLAEAIDWSKFE
jgi:hypothetical protein